MEKHRLLTERAFAALALPYRVRMALQLWPETVLRLRKP